jgi:SAM-dependent methyltransferase
MASVTQHYAEHLGPIYEWMLGDFDTAMDAARTDLRAANIVDGVERVAVDLGAGLGTHAIALAEAGFQVIAIDTCASLLEALSRRSGSGLAITAVQADLQQFRQHSGGRVDVIACMGDTLTHLASRDSVNRLLKTIATALAPGGTFVTTFRDYSADPLEGNCRVIPVRQGDDRILTCVLEYHTKTLTVHDVVHERTNGGWNFRVSSYPKLRLSPTWVQSTLSDLGLTFATGTTAQGMVRLAATRDL